MDGLGFVIIMALAAAAAVFLWLLARSLRERAVTRRALDIGMLEVLLPRDLKKEEKKEGIGNDIKERIAVAEQWLSTFANLPVSGWDRLLYGRPILVLEITAREDGLIVFYAGTERRFLDHLEKQIYAFYPEAEVRPMQDHTIFESGDTIRLGLLQLRRKHHLPLVTYKELEADPMQSLTGALAKIRNKDAAMIQMVCRPASERTRKRGKRAAQRTVRGKQSDVSGKFSLLTEAQKGLTQKKEEREKQQYEAQKLSPRAQQRVELVEQKLAQQQFDVNIRVGVSCRQPEDSERVFNAIAAAFSQYDAPDLNSFKVKLQDKKSNFLNDLIFRVPRGNTASTYSTTELSSLFHFPLPTTATPNILWRGAKVAPAPPGVPTEGVYLGDNVYRGIDQPVHLSLEDRRRHLYLIGQTGTGKTTLFFNMAVQDIRAGHGVGVVDPHGDLIEDILLHIPPERMQDVILFDPRDTERPLGFNILEAHDPGQKDLIVNEVVQLLTKLAARLNPESIGPMFEHYLRNSLLALVEDPDATLVDVPRMFVDEQFRQQILRHNVDMTVRQFWEKEFVQSQRGQMSADMLSYVISKLGRFIGNAQVRNMIGQAHSSFDVREMMDKRKILLCNLSKGSLGDINADLLGFVLVSKIQIAALGRANVPAEQRPDFFLYLDEFQNFTTDSIATILSEARKYHLDLNITHQFIKQLDERIRDAVFGNVGTVVSYRIGVEDAEFMAKQFEPVFTDYDLISLERFTACVRLLSQGTPLRPFTLRIPPPPAGGSAETREAIRAHSREMYGRPRAEVEERILGRFRVSGATPPQAAVGDYMSESLFEVK